VTIEHHFELWLTPKGQLVASIYEDYIGISGQRRLGLVDRLGRVWHYDASEITQCLWCEICAREEIHDRECLSGQIGPQTEKNVSRL